MVLTISQFLAQMKIMRFSLKFPDTVRNIEYLLWLRNGCLWARRIVQMGADSVPPPSEGQLVTSHLMRDQGGDGAIKMLLASHYNNTLHFGKLRGIRQTFI